MIIFTGQLDKGDKRNLFDQYPLHIDQKETRRLQEAIAREEDDRELVHHITTCPDDEWRRTLYCLEMSTRRFKHIV
ncbi:MAG: hypothetical protein RJA61_138 [Candidatus Parcubacteria bacterium]|jgi:hypothetical protein